MLGDLPGSFSILSLIFSSTQNHIYPSHRDTTTCAHKATRAVEYRPSPKQKPIKVPQGMLNAPIAMVVAFNILYLVWRFILTTPRMIFHYLSSPLTILILLEGKSYSDRCNLTPTTSVVDKRLKPATAAGGRLGTLSIQGYRTSFCGGTTFARKVNAEFRVSEIV